MSDRRAPLPLLIAGGAGAQHTPLSTLNGHAKKVMFLQFHPVADNVLASVSADLTIKIWDIEKGKQRSELTGFGDLVQAISFSATGDQLAVTSKDKKLRIFDVRSGKITHEVANHEGVKNQRVVWLGNTARVATTGFSKTSDRQLYVRDINNFNDHLVSENIDTSSGVLMPFYDEDSKMLYLAGKGDGNIRYYEMTDEKPWQFLLSQYTSTDPQRGMGWLPKRGVNFSQCEIARVYKLTNNVIEPISFLVPRKSDSFQDDIFPDAITGDPALTADEFFDGKSSLPNRASLNGGIQTSVRREVNYTPGAAEEKPAAAEPARTSVATKASSTTTSSWSSSRSTVSSAPAAAAASSAELEELKRANEQLKTENADLKAQVSALKSEVAQLQSGHAQAAKDLEAANARAEQLAAANAELEAKVQELEQHQHQHHHHHHEEAAGDAEVQATEDYDVVDAAEAEQSDERTHEAAGEEQDE